MTALSGDRRARRSRKLLKQGFLELLREKGFSRISVRDITERMDLNRGTFYLHYPDTTALMRSVEEDMVAEVQALVDAQVRETGTEPTLRPVFEAVLDYVVSHRETCAALFRNDSASGFLSELQKLVYQNGVSIIRARYALKNETALQYLLCFLAYGLAGLIKTWFEQDMALPKEDLIRAADTLASGAADSFLGKAGLF